MSLFDLDCTPTIDGTKQYDFVIVGAGAAGIFLADRLQTFGYQILLVEHGNLQICDDKQQYNKTVQTGKILKNDVDGRKRAIGGTTLAWGGQSLPFTALDFETRDWMNHSGWPISYDDIYPHYNTANTFMNIDNLDYKNDILNLFKSTPPAFDEKLFDYHFSKWAPEPDFQKLHLNRLKSKVDIIYNACLTRIIRKKNKIAKIIVKNSKFEQYEINVRTLIMAAGGIETNRILLNNNADKDGLNLNPDILGKFFMEHPCLEIGEITPNNPYQFQNTFNTKVFKGRKYSVRTSLSRTNQIANKELNASLSVMFVPKDGRFDPYSELKNFRNSRKINLLKLISDFPAIINSYIALKLHKFYYKKNFKSVLTIMCEQESSSDSFIRLSDEQDNYGLKKAEINWKISDKTWKAITSSMHLFGEEIERLNLGKLSIYDSVLQAGDNWEQLLTDVNHHMGGTRMGLSDKDSVVDKNLAVWGIDNFYICSASVFPTSSHSNPTLTLLALSSRLAQHLNSKLS